MKKFLIILLVCALCAGFCLPVFAEEETGDRLLTLVNPWNTLPEDWTVELVNIGNGHKVDKTCYDDLMAMLEACRADGLSPQVRSSYRTQKTQEQLYANKVRQWKGYGYDEEAARKKAATIVAVPGTSEHQLGWAVDIVDESYQVLDERQAETAAQQWLMAHSWEYGFLLRYPIDKSQVTGIIYEPWHYRYVGRDNAKKIFASGLCLEEYLEQEAQRSDVKATVRAALDRIPVDTVRRIFRLLTRGDALFEIITGQISDVMKP